MGIDQVTGISLGVTVVGIVLSLLVWRRRGAGAGLRGIAWSLIPLAAALTGVTTMLWRMGAAAAAWLVGFVFNPAVWAGVVLAGLSVVLFVVSGVLRARSSGAARAPKAREMTRTSKPEQVEGRSADADLDMDEIDAILKRRGID